MKTSLRLRAALATVIAVVALPVTGVDAVPAGRVMADELGGVVISEIMYNPTKVYDSRGEWFELHNESTARVVLDGWTIGDDKYDEHTIAALSIAPGARVVLARFGDVSRNGGVHADYVYGDAIVLFNSGDRISLRDGSGSLVDRVAYGDSGFPVADGRSLSLGPDAVDNSSGSAWCLATTTMPGGDLGSPGRPNECRASESSLVVSEVMVNPTAVDDASGEWFELTNVGGASVDLVGFTVQDDDGESFTVEGSHIVEPGRRVVLGTRGDIELNGGVEIDVAYGDAIRLHNTHDELIVNDPDGIQVDAVRWDDGATFPDPAGASLELADLASDNSLGASWCAATRGWGSTDLGTPGAANSCDAVPIAPVAITEIMFDPATKPDRDGEWFEITNLGATEAMLDGYVVRTRSREHVIDSLTIDAGGVAVLASSESDNGGVAAHHAYGTALAFDNTSGLVELATPDGTIVDRVAYSVGRGFPILEGRSIEVRSPDVDNSLGANWCATQETYGPGGTGTPGTTGTCPELAPAQPLVISEVMTNPAASLDVFGEWIEIFNPTADPVDLHRWRLRDHGSESYRFASSLVVPPDGVVVIGRSADTTRNGGIDVDLAVGVSMVLVDSADEVVLADPAGRVVDEVVWGAETTLPRPNGASVQRSVASMRALADNGDVSEWCSTSQQFGDGDRGTPGSLNDCAPIPGRTVVINEIHRDPGAEPDAQGEWIELYNTGNSSVDLGGWHLLDDDVDAWTFPPGVTIGAGEHLTVGRNPADINGGIALDVLYGAEIVLFNAEDELILLDAERAIVDRVAWTGVNGFPKVTGASMSLRDPGLDNSVGGNWCASVTDQGNGDFGTPGDTNVCVPPEPEPDLEPDPSPEPSPGMGVYSIFATGSADCTSEIRINASDLRVGSAVRANGDLRVDGSTMVFDGPISHGGDLRLGSGAVTTTVVHQPDLQVVPVDWSLARFMPGGDLAGGDHYHLHAGDLRISGDGADLAAGVHAVTGDVEISSGTALLNGVTIIAAGKIKIASSQIALSPFATDLPALYSARDSCHDDSISLSTSNLTVRGSVFVPGSGLRVSASMVKVEEGSFVGSSVRISGSKITLNVQAS